MLRERRGLPYCERMRNAGCFKPVVEDPQYAATAMHIMFRRGAVKNRINTLVGQGLGEKEAAVLSVFQVNGCIAAATSKISRTREWEELRCIIDEFVVGGFDRVLGKGGAEAEPRLGARA